MEVNGLRAGDGGDVLVRVGANHSAERSSPAGRAVTCCLLLGLLAMPAHGQTTAGSQPARYLDPAHDPSTLQLPPVTTLREQFIWTKDDAAALNPPYQAKVRGQDDKTAPHYFRGHFVVSALPKEAMLYLAGPRSATATLNGVKVLQFADDGGGKGFHVMTADVAGALKAGDNVLAIQEVRGHSSLHTGASPVINQVTYGEVLAVKIVPRGIAVDAPALVVSDSSWRSSLEARPGWESASFDDSGWPPVQTLGALGSRSDFLQWNADAGLYAWPGYAGISAAMRTFRMAPVAMRDVTQLASLQNADGLMKASPGGFRVLPGKPGEPVSLTLDFGKEINGRVHLVSSSDRAMTVATSYGESAEEALGHPYLGVRHITVPPGGEAFGPKSAFRYVRLTFLSGIIRVVRSAAQPHLGDGRVYRTPMHAGGHLGRSEARSRALDGRPRRDREGDQQCLCGPQPNGADNGCGDWRLAGRPRCEYDCRLFGAVDHGSGRLLSAQRRSQLSAKRASTDVRAIACDGW
jgi:hypothetical protein